MIATPNFDQEFSRLVPNAGKCDTLRGEVLRAAGRIIYRCYNDGDRVGSGYGHQTCDPAARFLVAKLGGNSKFGFTKTFENLMDGSYGLSWKRYTALVDRMATRIDKYVQTIPESANTDDMLRF